MYISKLIIKNFKCFDEVEINFDPNFNLIVGENNSGKSTIFEALRLWQLAIQQFYSKRTGKKGDGTDNISFYKKYQFEPLELNDLSFLRIDSLYNILNKKESSNDEDDDNLINNYKNTFFIEITFSNATDKHSSVPIIFRPSDKNVLRCSIKYDSNIKDEKFEELKLISHKLSEVMGLKNNATFINRIRLAYIPPKFTLPSKEVLLSKDNSYIADKLISGESNLIIRNILHHWAEFSYQVKTKVKSQETIDKALYNLKEIQIDPAIIENNFLAKIKPYIENVLEYNLQPKTNLKSKFLIKVEEGLKNIVNQRFSFKSISDPIENPFLQIVDDKKKTEISQLGSGTVNILNILAVLNYNEETIKGDATKCNILLLDEPDSHLQFNLQNRLFEYLEKVSQDEGRQIFIVTHNSSLISQFGQVLFVKNGQKIINPISIDDYLEKELKNIDTNHYNVMKDLSEAKKNKDSLIKQIKQIKNIETPLIYCEGPSDLIILENAFKKLYSTIERPFNLINGYSCTQLKNIFEDLKTFEKNEMPQISIFDFDIAYNQWNGLWGGKNKSFKTIETNHYKSLAKKHNNYNAYALLLPVPEIKEIKTQVLDPNNENENFGGDSILEIEHLFFDVNSLNGYFETKNKVGGGKCIYFKGDKISFANNTKNLSKNDFKHFIPLFEKIKEIIGFELPQVDFNA